MRKFFKQLFCQHTFHIIYEEYKKDKTETPIDIKQTVYQCGHCNKTIDIVYPYKYIGES